MELEIGRLNAVLEMKGERERSRSTQDSQYGDMQKRLMQSQQKENELKMNILAYKELVERKDEEIQSLQEQIGRMRNSSMYNNAAAFRGNNSLYGGGVGGGTQDNGINSNNDMMPPMCGTKDCRIFW